MRLIAQIKQPDAASRTNGTNLIFARNGQSIVPLHSNVVRHNILFFVPNITHDSRNESIFDPQCPGHPFGAPARREFEARIMEITRERGHPVFVGNLSFLHRKTEVWAFGIHGVVHPGYFSDEDGAIWSVVDDLALAFLWSRAAHGHLKASR